MTLIRYIDPHTIENNTTSSCQRLFHGRGNAYPEYHHISIDWLAPVIFITLYKETDPEWLKSLAEKLISVVAGCQSVQLQYRYQRDLPLNLLAGKNISKTQVYEHSLKYNIELGKSQNTGLFLDMKNGRHWVIENSKNKNVLNLFAYTCGFSVAALAGGAKQVANFDNNKSVLSKGRDNHRLNQQDTKKVHFQAVNIFNSWSRIKKFSPYDLMVCDPPTFQTGSVNIKKDYPKIIRRIPQFMTPNSDIMLCLNSPELSEQFLLDNVKEFCPECKYIKTLRAPDVFQESEPDKGLKILVFRFGPF